VPSNSSTALVASDPTADDPELLALPAPPKRERLLTVALMAVTGIAAALLAWSLRSEARYALAPGAPQELGDMSGWVASPGAANSYVTGTTRLLGTQGAIKYGRPAESDSFRLAPVAGNDKLWVEIRVPEGFEGPRFIPPSSFAGRLVPFSEAGLRHAGLRKTAQDRTGVTVPSDAWILIDGSSPRSSRWALALVVVFIGFSLWNAVGVVRLLARVRDRTTPDTRPEGAR
jgi:hypothetical protein